MEELEVPQWVWTHTGMESDGPVTEPESFVSAEDYKRVAARLALALERWEADAQVVNHEFSEKGAGRGLTAKQQLDEAWENELVEFPGSEIRTTHARKYPGYVDPAEDAH